LDSSYKKLASGLRINSARDDAAGLQIADRMTAQINGLTQGNRNANDGISMCQTVEGALDEVTNMLQRIRTLAIQSVNDTNSTIDRSSLNDEVKELKAQITDIGGKTKYGKNIQVFEGGTRTFQVGAYQGDTISITTRDMTQVLGGTGTSIAAGNKLSALQISTAATAATTITSIDNMLQNLDAYRAKLGATQNRLESTISNHENIIENVSDARSRIRDVDYASETAKMTQQSILQQASTTILSQANQKTQIALSLIGS
jgi:flagellin